MLYQDNGSGFSSGFLLPVLPLHPWVAVVDSEAFSDAIPQVFGGSNRIVRVKKPSAANDDCNADCHACSHSRFCLCVSVQCWLRTLFSLGGHHGTHRTRTVDAVLADVWEQFSEFIRCYWIAHG